MIIGSPTGTVSFTDAEGRSVLIESGVAMASVYSPDAAIQSQQEEVQVGPVLESPPTSVAALVVAQRFDDYARPGEAPASEMWMSGWSGWHFDGTHVLLTVNIAVQGAGVRIAAVSYHVTLHGHVEPGLKVVAGDGIQYVKKYPPLQPPP